MRTLFTLVVILALTLTSTTVTGPADTASGAPASAAAAPGSTLPSHSSVVRNGRLAIDYFYTQKGGAGADAGWRWAPFFMGMEALYRETGDDRYRRWLTSWGERNDWRADAPASPTSNPDSRAAIQVYQDAAASGIPADLGPADEVMARDLTLPPEQYWWIDSIFMGLTLWPRWAARTGDPAYQAKHAGFYDFLKDDGATTWRTGCTGTGLFDETEDLWWRDCKYVSQRDSQGHKVFWSRGNGWVLAGLTRTLAVLPAGDPQRAEYVSMVRRMSARLVPLQGTDGLWRTSLLSPSLHPEPETSGTALFTYAMAYGIRTGLLDSATYLPVVARAWNGMTATSLRSSGFLANCQGVGEAPGTPSTTTSIAYCVGAYALAASEVAKLSPNLAHGKAVSVTAQQQGTEGPRLVDSRVTTRWSTAGYPQSAVIDLGAVRPIGSTQLSPYGNRPYRYRIQTSLDRVAWTTRVDRATNTLPGPFIDDLAAPVSARYLRVTVLGIADGSTGWVSLLEFKAFRP